MYPSGLEKESGEAAMNRKEVWRFGCRTLSRKSTCLILMFWTISFFCLFSAVFESGKLAEEWNYPVTIRFEIPENLIGQLGKLREMEGTKFLFRWEESIQTMELNGYQAQILLVGVEKEYLENNFPQYVANGISETMPGIWVEESAFYSMENGRKEKLTDLRRPDFLYEILEINGVDARIYGIIPERMIRGMDEKDKSWNQGNGHCVYTTPEAYERIVSGHTDVSQAVNIHSETDAEVEVEKGTQRYYLEAANIRAGEVIRSAMEQDEMVITNTAELEEKSEVLEALRDKILLEIFLSIGALVSGGVLIRTQGKLWEKNHEVLIQYLCGLEGGEVAWKRIYRSRIWICLLAGGFAGAVFRWIGYF